MEHKKYSKIELTTSSEDWEIIRECYVQSFRRYPLYKYMVPDETKRDDFLRAYLDANYEVTVGSGQGILLAIKSIDIKHYADSHLDDLSDSDLALKVVGGVVFVPPASDGCGWAVADDEPYFKAYDKHGLGEISSEGLERVKRYESWENEHVCKRVSLTRIPVWNGFFCAIQPQYTSKGLGTAVYKEAIRIMAEYWVAKPQRPRRKPCAGEDPEMTSSCAKHEPARKYSASVLSSSDRLDKLMKNVARLNQFSLLSHRPLPSVGAMPAMWSRGESEVKKSAPLKPLVVVVSHSERSAHFHKSNGFNSVARLQYTDPVLNYAPFYAHVLLLDPFKTGKVPIVKNAMNDDVTGLKATQTNRAKRNVLVA